jgi:cytochrome b pre-mRNA-processing protein 3|tara:strand:- start:334 stop:801 length:468 start_codon:yes stop_codon:yes gene_type:complete
MNNKYINIYNNLINLTRNKELYKGFTNQDTFSDRLVFFLIHFAFFLKTFKNNDKNTLQDIYDCIFRHLELNIREIGYGDASINKKMKDYINLFHLIINKIDDWNFLNQAEKKKRLKSLLNINDIDNLSVYFDNYSVELQKNTLNYYIKSVIKPEQ